MIGITSSTDISVARTYSGVPFVLFMPQPTTEIVALSWSVGTDWVRWACFDAVPAPKRVASGNANDGMLQVYATTELGELFARQELLTGYLPWSQLAPPDSVGLALDVASVDGSVAGGVPWTLYLATDTGVFARTRPIDESQVTDAAWVQVLAGSASRVAAGVLNDGRHDLLAVTERGALVEALQLAPGAQYVFADPLEASHGRRFVDVDFGKNSLGESQTFGVLVDGSLVVRTRSGDGWTDWNELSAATRPTLRSIAVGTLPDQPPILFGIGTYNIPYYSMNAGTSWAPRL